jgi:hypothetical protein
MSTPLTNLLDLYFFDLDIDTVITKRMSFEI